MNGKRAIFPETCPWCQDPMVLAPADLMKRSAPAVGHTFGREESKSCPAYEAPGVLRDLEEWNFLARNGAGRPAEAKQHRFVMTTCDPQQLILFCQDAEDQGFTVLNATIAALPAQGPQGVVLMPTAVIMLIVPRSAPKTKIEQQAEAESQSKIVKLR